MALNDNNHKQINTKNLTKSLNNVGNPNRNMKNIKPLKKEKSKKRKNIQNSIIITNNISNSKNIIHINMSKKPQKKVKFSNKNMIKKNEIDEYNEYKINNLDYPKAIIYDHRTYCQYYISLIKMKHIFIFTFFYNKDYNSRIIKIYIFFFNFLINYTLNAMFYSNKIMHKIYIEKGVFNFIYQLPDIIYSAIINIAINILIKKLGLYDNGLKIEIIKKKIQKELIKIKCKIITFFIITYILLVFFWLYLGCFCAVYSNTQKHLLKEVFSSFITSMIIPLIINIFPGIFRIPSLKSKKPFLYKLSKFIQLF